MYAQLQEIFTVFIEYCIMLIEIIGVFVLLGATVRAVVSLIRFRRKMNLRLELAEGFALALEFKMGGELLRTLIVREWNELLILGSIILLRAALTFFIQWEIKNERKVESEKLLTPEK